MQLNSPQATAWLSEHQQRVTTYINAFLEQRNTAQSSDLIRMMRYALEGGRAIRPLLVYATAQYCQTAAHAVDQAAAAIEFIHTYSLIHDDLPCMDDAETRRGKPSLHNQFGEAASVLAGDALLTCAFECLTDHHSDQTAPQQMAMVKHLASAAGVQGMLAGQMLDLSSASELTLADVQWMMRAKTARLFQASVTLALACQNSMPETEQRALIQWAAILGLLFQLQDDIQDRSEQDNINYVALVGYDAAVQEAHQQYQMAQVILQSLPGSVDALRLIMDYAIAALRAIMPVDSETHAV